MAEAYVGLVASTVHYNDRIFDNCKLNTYNHEKFYQNSKNKKLKWIYYRDFPASTAILDGATLFVGMIFRNPVVFDLTIGGLEKED
jgi:hypothetical protein